MNTNKKVLLYSLIVGVLYAGYNLLQPINQTGEFGDLANGLGYIFIGIILSPIVFGVITFVLSKDKKIIQAFSALGISLVVMLVLMMVGGFFKNAEMRNAYPTTQIPVLVPVQK